MRKGTLNVVLSRINSFLKDIIIYSRISLLFTFFQHWLNFFANLIGLTKFVHQQSKKQLPLGHKFQWTRKYALREQMHAAVVDYFDLGNKNVQYLEFGVFGGASFEWWMAHLKHENASFAGFDTFEGLPEKWGAIFKQGDFNNGLPTLNDKRAVFVKGLFQHTLYDFIKSKYRTDAERTIIHLDADLFSSTLFVLTALAPYLKSGDILLFDEFTVPNHEYLAWDIFCRSYYVEYEVLGAVNNFYQTAILFKKIGKFD